MCSKPIENKLVGPGAEEQVVASGTGGPGAEIEIGNPAWSVREPMTVIVDMGWPNKLRYDYHEDCYPLGLEKVSAEWKKWKRRQANLIAARKRAKKKPKAKGKGKGILEVKPRTNPKAKKDA